MSDQEDEHNETQKLSTKSLSRAKRTPFITKNAMLISRAARHKGSTGKNYHY